MPSDQVQQNIRVAVRCRPLNKYELEKSALNCVTCTRDKITVKERNTTKVFTFDQVFNPYSKQIDVYNSMVAPVVEEILMGYNCTIFAYGQTGSGKTFTMTGERSDKLRYAWEDDPMVGIIPRALSHLFENLEQTGADFSVRVSFLEVYNEELFDLLAITETNRLAIYDDVNRKGSVIVKGLREVVVLDKDNVHSVIERGLAKRQTASTLLNAQSSRSHSIFTVTVHIKEINEVSGEELLRIGKLHLVDLAGSESIGRSGAVDKRAREAGSINQSLLTLGRVITALVDHTPHVPYRESKLTRLLQDSLGGKTKTSIIATISPSTLSLDETLSTLDYAHRAKNIENRPEINLRLNKTDLVRGYNEELERLRRDLEAARTKTGIFVDTENYQALQNQIRQQRERICELEERREIQEHDMAELQEMFTLTQAELSEARERQEQVEKEIIACQADLEEKRLRLLSIKFRLEEEEHLRRQHEQTENVLREQANSLLTTARSAIDDVTGLHDKVRRLTDLDQDNRDRLTQLPSTWAMDRLAEPLTQLDDLSGKLDVFYQQLRNALADLRTNEDAATTVMLRRQEMLRSELATRLADECIHAAEQTDQFASEQLKLSADCLESILHPVSERINSVHIALRDSIDKMSQLLLDHHTTVQDQHKRINCLIEQAVEFSKRSTDFVTVQLKRNAESQKVWNDHCITQENLLQSVRASLQSLDEEHKTTRDFVLTKFASEQTDLEDWHKAYAQDLEKFTTALSSTNQTAFNNHTIFHMAGSSYLECTCKQLTSVSDEQQCMQEKVDICLSRLCEQAKTFSDEGLGADLRKRAEQWKTNRLDGSDVDPQHTSILLQELISKNAESMSALSEINTKKALDLENLSGDTSYQMNVGFASIKDDLKALPTDLNKQLSEDLRSYIPTGQTPQPRVFTYPEQLAQTASHGRLRRAFRKMQQKQGLELAALTPIPPDSHMTEQSDSPGAWSLCGGDNANVQENAGRVSTSGLGSESSVSGILREQNLQIRGRIFPNQPKDCDNPNDVASSDCKDLSPVSLEPSKMIEPSGSGKPAPPTPIVQRGKPRKKAVNARH
ncbi:Kinesin motor domain protein [Paragonimus heterotremus]|uniref:Kinesin motor domain protein n=1 Tax=Paragonimus heterotremus TaxID=100268 RepID=A0A8J4TBD6_9TREM|nr:Kinesin motor domain protein [Paragonimus heterotremus]